MLGKAVADYESMFLPFAVFRMSLSEVTHAPPTGWSVVAALALTRGDE